MTARVVALLIQHEGSAGVRIECGERQQDGAFSRLVLADETSHLIDGKLLGVLGRAEVSDVRRYELQPRNLLIRRSNSTPMELFGEEANQAARLRQRCVGAPESC